MSELTSKVCVLSLCFNPEMFHPRKIPQRQRNGNETGLQRVPVANPLNVDGAPVAGRCWPNGRSWICNGVINFHNLGQNLLNNNVFCNGWPVATRWAPVATATGAVFDD